MMEEIATVVAVDDSAVDKSNFNNSTFESSALANAALEKSTFKKSNVTVQSQVKSTCSSCQQADTCGSGIVAKAIPQKKLTVTLTSNLPVKVGDCVVLGIPEHDVLQTAWQVYLWPLIGLILFSALGQQLIEKGIFSHELFGLFLGVSGGYLGYRLAKYYQKRPGRAERLQPKILRVLPSPKLAEKIIVKEI
jgi:sigma-E factor negative regulatory protein RseC